jgi:N,N'-diacetyllegionaminate synthase
MEEPRDRAIRCSTGMAGRVFIVAEAGMNHDGSLGVAGRMVDVAAECGADAIKFQLHDARAETTADAPSPPYFKAESRFEYFERTAFDDEQWRSLRLRCERAGIEFVCSPFSIDAVERLEQIGVDRYKIASGEVTNLPLLERIAGTGKPVLLSSGMSSWAELDAAVAALREGAGSLTVLQCSSEYPCLPERVGLNVMSEMAARYDLPVGLSDHTLTSTASLAAVTLGASAIEKHFTLSRRLYGPDAALSLEPEELGALVRATRELERMLAAIVDKDDVAPYRPMKDVFEKSVVAVAAIHAGEPIGAEALALKKPGTGIPARRLGEVVGRRARVDIAADSVLRDDDVDWGDA